MSTHMEDINKRLVKRYHQEVMEGLHDETCEYLEIGFHLCHCSKRRREAEGKGNPIENLTFYAPDCPRCHAEVESSGDGFDCYTCSGQWSYDGNWEGFTDDYGENLAAESKAFAKKRAHA